MNKKISLGAAITFMIVVAGITFCITMMVALNHFNDMVLNVKEREEMYKKIGNIDAEIRQNLAGADKIDEETLSDMLSAGYIHGIGDKYAAYLTKKEYEAVLQEQNGQLVSIGVVLAKDQTGYLKVLSVQEGSPAEQNGIHRGDLLISVDGTDLKSLSLSRGKQLLKGSVGTKVSVVYRRDGVDFAKTLQRITLTEVVVEARMIEKTGYILIREFNSSTSQQFKTAVEELMNQGAVGLVFDVRGNNSDSISAANQLLNFLLPAGDLGTIVYADGSERLSGSSDSYSISLPMSVLVDANTGCAAEYFTAMLREYEKVSVVGVQTMGKSAMQELRPLNDGSALYFTVSHFITPAGINIEGVGIKPDYEVKLDSDKDNTNAAVTDDTDVQLRKALEAVNSKVIIEEESSAPSTEKSAPTADANSKTE